MGGGTPVRSWLGWGGPTPVRSQDGTPPLPRGQDQDMLSPTLPLVPPARTRTGVPPAPAPGHNLTGYPPSPPLPPPPSPEAHATDRICHGHAGGLLTFWRHGTPYVETNLQHKEPLEFWNHNEERIISKIPRTARSLSFLILSKISFSNCVSNYFQLFELSSSAKSSDTGNLET